MLGFLLDAMDVMLLVFALQTLRREFGLTNAQAGLLSAATLVTSAVGGLAAGFLCDRFGRRRVLVWTILIYSFASAGTALSGSIGSLIFWRALVGLGLGGEWSAGATLVSESWPAEHRGRAIGFMQAGWALGYMLAAVVSGLILPRYGWRMLFLAGLAPALITIWVRRKVAEPAVWQQRQPVPWRSVVTPQLVWRTVRATTVASVVLFAYWGLFTWLPSFLGAPVAQGGAGLDLVKTSRFVFLSQTGAWLGYVCFGAAADWMGRRVAFAGYVTVAAILVPLFGLLPQWAGDHQNLWLQILAPALGFFGTGFFSLFGSMLAELFPTPVRGTGQGLTYNVGRGIAALAPYAIGGLADRWGLGSALMLTSLFFLAGGVLIFSLPETRHMELETAA